MTESAPVFPSGSPVIIIFSHLRWDFVTQRPQHIISRFSNERIFVEEPVDSDLPDDGRMYQAGPKLKVVQPKPGRTLKMLKDTLKKHEGAGKVKPILWFYSAAFHEFVGHLEHSLVVYDCMDELSAFKGASKKLIRQEEILLQKADLVFTGGKSLYEAKSKLHPHVFCYPSSVDKPHFQKAIEEETTIPEDLLDIPAPRISYIGVIDERINLDLLQEAAQKKPDVSFVMIGPVVKISENQLPDNPNIHYLGSRPYELLPNYLKGSDITMMPFALNEATEFISPTKTLEYIAAHKPVISTPIHDVVRDYSDYLKIAETADDFTKAIDHYREETLTEQEQRIGEFEELLLSVSWDQTVAGMKKHINERLAEKSSQPRHKPKPVS